LRNRHQMAFRVQIEMRTLEVELATGLEKQQLSVQNHVANCLPNLNSEATQPRTILLVEDEAFVRDVWMRLCSRLDIPC
jgi:hypothetical protein